MEDDLGLATVEQPAQLAALAYESLHRSILSGRLKVGSLHNEMKLARELGISRTPVREALLELASRGLVEILPRKGIRVKLFTEKDVHEVFQIREIMEVGLVESVVKQGCAGRLSDLKAVLERQQSEADKGNDQGFLMADRLFHSTLCQLADNSRLSVILENLRDLIHVMGAEALLQKGRFDEVVAEHREICQYLEMGNAEEARVSVIRHLLRSKNAVLEQYHQHHTITEDSR